MRDFPKKRRLGMAGGLFGALAILYGFPVPGLFAKSVYEEIEAINASCKKIDSGLKNNVLTSQCLATLSTAEPESWKKFNNEAELEKACPQGCYQKALAYLEGLTLVLASCEFKSPSREWVHYLKYYFRADGTLERIHSDFRRFGAYEKEKGMEQQFLVKVVRDRYYAANGKCIKKAKPRYFNMATHRQVNDVVFTDISWPLFSRIEKLPFYGMIQPLASPESAKH